VDKLASIIVAQDGKLAKTGNRLTETRACGNGAGGASHWLSVTTHEESPPEKI
jgi:hypothetical protein